MQDFIKMRLKTFHDLLIAFRCILQSLSRFLDLSALCEVRSCCTDVSVHNSLTDLYIFQTSVIGRQLYVFL